MGKDKVVSLEGQVAKESKASLEELVREGARRMLQEAMEFEVREYIERHQERRDGTGRRLVVRNGSLPEREILSGVGPLRIKQPRAHDRREGQKFSSQILPPYMRRVPSIDALIPALYLKGISTGDFSEALSAILGENAAGLSPTNIVRLKRGWEEEYKEWSRRGFSDRQYVYLWADGIHFNVRLEPDRPCMLVIIGTLLDGTKELVSVQDGHRESKESWLEMLRDLKNRGLKGGPKLAVGAAKRGGGSRFDRRFPGPGAPHGRSQ